MIRARSLLPAGTWDAAQAADRVVLPHDGRHRRRIAMRGEGDVVFLLDLPEATRLKQGDGLALDDGRTIAVVAADEPVAEIVARDSHHLARLAWHLGNRHVPAELLEDRIRIARDPVLEEMARGLGARVDVVDAAFEPEGGAYEAAEAHGHPHGHAHDDAHDHHHAHGEACGCGHDHGDHDHEHHDHERHGHQPHSHHDHGDAAHAPAAAPERDVLHVHEHAREHAHEHKHGDACGCGQDHSHDHEHAHDPSHGHRHGH
ncbi:urease accessory protein [Angulomicrobium tetraedrale]|uniref:Urease accessory protein UreE n=1 Tax=Ancylobacter tetraedralis TaxID=217068 RepID=A0A839Z8J9_9HYPH|nr:urease accessory protein UreE [Ancylobacter tetraedralis]MBB3771250.1 urease accessory protein [Ancylobacter tetraedralis]